MPGKGALVASSRNTKNFLYLRMETNMICSINFLNTDTHLPEVIRFLICIFSCGYANMRELVPYDFM